MLPLINVHYYNVILLQYNDIYIYIYIYIYITNII